MLNRRLLLTGAIALACGLAHAQSTRDFPNKPIKVVVPSPAGGPPDLVLRAILPKLSAMLGQPIIIDNRAGAGGMVGTAFVAKQPADGYTWLFTTASHVNIPPFNENANYDPIKDFTHVTLAAQNFGQALVVHPDVPAKNLQELIALAKSKPGELNCASSGLGTPAHLGCEMFNAMAGVKTVHVPFRDVSAAVNAIVSGYVQMLFAVSVNAQPQIDSGVLRGIAISTEHRSKLFPTLPTLNENGIPGFIVTGWGSLVAPARTPQPVVQKLNTEVQKILKDKDAKVSIEKLGMEPNGVETPEQFREFIRTDTERWNKLIDVTGVKRGKS
jgi:tripartite-type tricarboxylate transporter receptor subunit TctC